MPNFDDYSNDELRDLSRNMLREIEARLEAEGAVRLLSRFQRIHALLWDFEHDAFDAGHIEARTSAEDKT